MTLTISEITAAVAEEFDVQPGDITGPHRYEHFIRPRFAVYSIAFEAGYKLTTIGRRIGDRDHTSVLAGKRRALEFCETDAKFKASYDRLKAAMLGRAMFSRQWVFSSIRAK